MPTYAIGDIHGCLNQTLELLKSAELTDEAGHWTAMDAHLWFLGDFTDRGPDGMGVIDLVMRLEKEAVFEGGFVGALLGNHDLIKRSIILATMPCQVLSASAKKLALLTCG
jgi:Calcineurin-like phosphoesterase